MSAETDRESIYRRIYLAEADPEEYAGKRGKRGFVAWRATAVMNALDPVFHALRQGQPSPRPHHKEHDRG